MVTMSKALLKDTFRSIWRTKARFISIILIVALGIGFFAGIKATAPDMKETANRYFLSNNLMDLRVLSTVGFEQADVDARKMRTSAWWTAASYPPRMSSKSAARSL